MMKHSLWMIAGFLVLTVIGCGSRRMEVMEVAELGLSMDVPSGWRVDSHNPRLCTKGDNTGLIIDEPLEGKVFSEYVRQLSEENWGKVISSTPITINGYDAIQTVIEYPIQGSKSIKVYIHKGNRLIEVSFVTLAGDFPKYEPSLRKSIKFLKIE